MSALVRIPVSPRGRFETPLVLLLILGVLCFAHPAKAYQGRWTTTRNWGFTAVNLVLLPGDDSPYHSRVVWWAGEDEVQFKGGQWGWRPGSDGCTAWPSASFDSLKMPVPGVNIFCSGNTPTAEGGKLFVPGGTVGAEDGVRSVRIFTPGAANDSSGIWTAPSDMQERRWYPSATVLSDGRIIVASGSKYRHLNIFGGRQEGSFPTGQSADTLFRFGVVPGGEWDTGILPDLSAGQRPKPREGHTAVSAATGLIVFAGRDGAGNPLQDLWFLQRQNNPLAPDYGYPWQKIVPGTDATHPDPPPRERSEHSAVVLADDTTMVVFGGLGKTTSAAPADTAYNDVWRLWFDTASNPARWRWTQMTISGTPPSARYGHTAVLDTNAVSSPRILVFGGIGVGQSTPTDNTLYALTLTSPNSANWSTLTPSGPTPAARYDHSMNVDRLFRFPGPNGSGHYAVMYGGRLNNTTCDDHVWRLWLYSSGSVEWQQLTVAGTSPGPRAAHSATYDAAAEQLYVLGGVDGGGQAADKFVYAADVSPYSSPEWERWQDHPQHSFANQTAVAYPTDVFARVPEIYNPAGSGSWTRLNGAPLLQPYYPLDFVVPGGRVVSAGGVPEPQSYWLDVAQAENPAQNSPWRKFTNGHAGFSPSSGVMYRPGRIMIAGGAGAGAVLGRTLTLEILSPADTTNGWFATADSMQPRINHNLVLLPTGQVLALGGTGIFDNFGNIDPVRRPQIWTPGGDLRDGTWSSMDGSDTLAIGGLIRGYHSTAILLPDARVLSAGGNNTLPGPGCSPCDTSQVKANLFCPPYLFTSSGNMATRPVLAGAPPPVRYGSDFSVCLSQAATISTVSLIRAGAATHGFDQSQRYVPLSFSPQGSLTTTMTATAPLDGSYAPPGDYMLFVVNDQGVPSIARWVKLLASSDVTAPSQITDLTRDLVTSTAVHLVWTATGDDGTTGTATYADLRYSGSAITAANFCAATPAFPRPVVATPGTLQHFTVTGLAPHHNYWFAIKFWDEAGNTSIMSTPVTATTLDDCCIGERAERARDEGNAAGANTEATTARPGRTASPTALVPTGTGTGLVLEVVTTAHDCDVRVIAVDDETYEGLAGPGATGVALQDANGAGQWATRLRYDLPDGVRFGLCAPEAPARWLFPSPCALEQVLPAVATSAATWALGSAWHSRTGDVTAPLTGGTGPPAMMAGDTLSLHYVTAPATGAPQQSWLVVLDRAASALPAARARKSPEPATALPAVFALRQNQPNPFEARTTIGFDLPTGAVVRLEVFDVAGRRLRVLADCYYAPGYYTVEWDKRTTSGSSVGPGMYFYRIQAGPFRARRKMVLLP
jgi:galactose oxidase-like protein